MMSATQYLQEQAATAAAKRIQKASTFTGLHIKKPLFQKRMGKGANSVLVRFDWPGVLGVYDPETGETLAFSEPGKPGTLAANFLDV